MNAVLTKIFQQAEKKVTPRFGSMIIEVTFHDGRATKWEVTTTESHNVQQQKKEGPK